MKNKKSTKHLKNDIISKWNYYTIDKVNSNSRFSLLVNYCAHLQNLKCSWNKTIKSKNKINNTYVKKLSLDRYLSLLDYLLKSKNTITLSSKPLNNWHAKSSTKPSCRLQVVIAFFLLIDCIACTINQLLSLNLTISLVNESFQFNFDHNNLLLSSIGCYTIS